MRREADASIILDRDYAEVEVDFTATLEITPPTMDEPGDIEVLDVEIIGSDIWRAVDGDARLADDFHADVEDGTIQELIREAIHDGHFCLDDIIQTE